MRLTLPFFLLSFAIGMFTFRHQFHFHHTVKKDTGSHSPDFVNKYKRLSFWVPGDNTPVKTVRIAIHVFTGPGSLGPEDADWLKRCVDEMNVSLSNVCAPSDTVPGVEYIMDSKIRLEVDNRIYFYDKSPYYRSNIAYGMLSYIRKIDSTRLNYLSVLIPMKGSGIQNATPPFPSYLPNGSPISSLNGDMFALIPTDSTNPNWAFLSTFKHELAHCLDLLHTYNDGNGETCDTASSDYLWDVFGREGKKNCWLQGGWSCDPLAKNTTCTNNWMGGWAGACYLSPLQMAKMNRALSLKSTRHYVKDEPVGGTYHITKDETWDFDVRWYGDIIVKPGVTWIIRSRLRMSAASKIKVEKGGKLIIDGGLIYEPTGKWQGIVARGDVQMINGGSISDATHGVEKKK